jgi:hypothetical protein
MKVATWNIKQAVAPKKPLEALRVVKPISKASGT